MKFFRIALSDPRARALFWQVVVVGLVFWLIYLLVGQTAANLQARGLASGFGFLEREAGFQIAEGPLSYRPSDDYGRALAVGLVNTGRVALLGITLATLLGLAIGIARLSSIWIVSTLSRYYVEILRNTPLLLQLLFWYSLMQGLPGPRQALNPFPGVFLSVRGVSLPGLAWDEGFSWVLGALVLGVVLAPVLARVNSLRRDRTGQEMAVWRWSLTGMAILLAIGYGMGRPDLVLDIPHLQGFGFQGGMSLSPEFAALLISLTTYTSAFIGEIIRGGISAVDKGQKEAAAALGLSRGRALRLIVLPQALRIIIPPTTSQFLNLTKNSSLAVAIGYPELVSVANTTLNQTGQAIEVIALIMLFYLAISLSISLAMNLYSRSVALRER
jgi:general L-amino acid transport system permease protein